MIGGSRNRSRSQKLHGTVRPRQDFGRWAIGHKPDGGGKTMHAPKYACNVRRCGGSMISDSGEIPEPEANSVACAGRGNTSQIPVSHCLENTNRQPA